MKTTARKVGYVFATKGLYACWQSWFFGVAEPTLSLFVHAE
jgi:hypothetical protein